MNTLIHSPPKQIISPYNPLTNNITSLELIQSKPITNSTKHILNQTTPQNQKQEEVEILKFTTNQTIETNKFKSALKKGNGEIKGLIGEVNSGRWTKEEHHKFVKAICQYGNEWKKVQEFIPSRSSTQARSHAQKFFIRMQNKLNFLKKGSVNELKYLSEEILMKKIKESANIGFEITKEERDKLIDVLFNFAKIERNKKNDLSESEIYGNNHREIIISYEANQPFNQDLEFVNNMNESKNHFKIEKSEKFFLKKKLKNEVNLNSVNYSNSYEFMNINKNESSDSLKSDLMTYESLNQNQIKGLLKEDIKIRNNDNLSYFNHVPLEHLPVKKALDSKKSKKSKKEESKQKKERKKKSKIKSNILAQQLNIEVHNYSLNQGPYPFNIDSFITPTMKESSSKLEEEIINPFEINFPMENKESKEDEILIFDDFYPMYN